MDNTEYLKKLKKTVEEQFEQANIKDKLAGQRHRVTGVWGFANLDVYVDENFSFVIEDDLGLKIIYPIYHKAWEKFAFCFLHWEEYTKNYLFKILESVIYPSTAHFYALDNTGIDQVMKAFHEQYLRDADDLKD